MLLLSICIFAGLGGFTFGYDLGLMGGVLELLKEDIELTSATLELVVGACKIGAALGALSCTWLLRRGHSVCFALSAIMYVSGPLVMAMAATWQVVFVGRLLSGFAVGVSAVVSPSYLGEVAPPSLRGAIVATYELSICLGLVVAPVVDWALQTQPAAHFLPSVARWRICMAIAAVPGVVLLVGAPFIPASPFRLLRLGRRDEGILLLSRLYGAPLAARATDNTRETTRMTSPPLSRHNSRLSHLPADDGPAAPRVPLLQGQSVEPGLLLSAVARASASADSLPSAGPLGSLEDGYQAPSRPRPATLSAASFSASNPHAPLSVASFSSTIVDPRESRLRPSVNRAIEGALRAADQPVRSVSVRQLFFGSDRRAAWLLAALAICNQANGSSTVISYTSELLIKAGADKTPDNALQSALVGATKLVGVIFAMRLIDTLGRRPLLIVGSISTAAALMLTAFAVHISSPLLTLVGHGPTPTEPTQAARVLSGCLAADAMHSRPRLAPLRGTPTFCGTPT